MKKLSNIAALLAVALLSSPTFAAAEGAASGDSAGLVAIGSGIAVSLAALGGTLGQGKGLSAALEALGRNPSASGQIFTPLLIGLAFIESLVILAFVVAFLLLGKI